MQELIDAHHCQHPPGFVVIAPQVNYMPALSSPTETPSPATSSWMSLSPNVCSPHSTASYQPYMTDANTYPFASHMATNSAPKPAIGQNYFQSEPESVSNQSEPQTRIGSLLDNNKSPNKKKKASKSSYKHVPHREKPVHLVARRNARERRRVQAVNSAFIRLRKCVPVENRNKRLSKVKTLHRAIEYIAALQDLIQEADQRDGIAVEDSPPPPMVNSYVKSELDCTAEKKYNKENRIGDQKWISIESVFNDWQTINNSYHSLY